MASEQVKQILELIRETRTKKGLSQRDVAEKLGLSQNGYKNIEIGKTDLKVDMLLKIMEALDIQNDLFQAPSSPIQESADTDDVYLPSKPDNLEDLYKIITQKLATKSDLQKQGQDIEELKSQMKDIQSMLKEILKRDK